MIIAYPTYEVTFRVPSVGITWTVSGPDLEAFERVLRRNSINEYSVRCLNDHLPRLDGLTLDPEARS